MSSFSSSSENAVHSTASHWTTFAQKYNKSTGGATRVTAKQLVSLSPPFSNSSVILDNACGTGIVTEEIQHHLSSNQDQNVKVKLVAADSADGMVQYYQAQTKEASRWPNIDFIGAHTVRAEELNESVVPSNSITHAYMNFGLFFCDDPDAGARNLYRALAPGGTALVTFWKDLGYISAWKQSMEDCPEDNIPFKEPFGAQWKDPAHLKDLFQRAGFSGDKIKVLTERSYYRAKDLDELAMLQTELFSYIVRGSPVWPSDEAKRAFTAALRKNLAEEKNLVHEENGVAITMLANIAICTK